MLQSISHWFANTLFNAPRARSGNGRLEKTASSSKRVFAGERLVFVGGSPRSGTTILQQMLHAHSAIHGGPEFDHMPTIVNTWKALIGALDAGRITAFCTRHQIDEAVGSLIESLLLPAADEHNARFLSEKTPFNVLVFSELLELLPRCRTIQIIRDPRAVVASLLKVGERCKREEAPEFTQKIHAAIELTRSSIDAGFKAASMHPDRCLTVTYEKLVLTPEATARELSGFLGLTFEPSMLRPDQERNPSWDSIAKLDAGRWFDPSLGYCREIEATRLECWKNQLPPDQVQIVNAAFRDHAGLLKFGYRFE